MATEKTLLAVIRAARPSFRNDHDKVAFAVHATFLATGHVLTATGPSAFSEDALSNPFTDEVGNDRWNERDDEYAFVYINPEKGSKKVLVKCLVMGDKLLVHALSQGVSEPSHLEINVVDYVGENGSSNYSAQFKNLEKLLRSLDTEILSKLDGSSSSSSNPPRSQTSERSRSNINVPGIGFGEPAGPPTHPSGIVYPPVNPYGGSDLFPGPGAGMYPSRGDSGGGSMLLGPNDPRWFGGEPGILGGPPGVPPGARFDPYGPPGVPGFEPNRFARKPRRPGGSIHPDLEHFRNDRDYI
ncbi:Proteasome inhibitor-related [Quillaja saponaria]|uniref:Proteasome inhibitor-related n=1 Tax=Quillaja saponaria TaxID=32244 RepID=A0AAD7L2L9_QUISA|nr:Proteasome inhibitor-related [Quillaja saponaria]